MKIGKFIKRTAELTAVVAAGAYVYGKVKKYEKEIDVDDVPRAVINDLKETAKVRLNEVVEVYNDISNEFKENADDFIHYKEIDKDFDDAALEMESDVFVETETEEESEESAEEDEEPESDPEAEEEPVEEITRTVEPEAAEEPVNLYGVVDEDEIEEPLDSGKPEPSLPELEEEEPVEFQIIKDEDLESRSQYINSIRNFFPYVNKNLIENVYQQKDVIAKSYKTGLHVRLYHLLSFTNKEDLDSFIKILDKHNYESEIVGDGLQVEIINDMKIKEGTLLTDIYVVANQAGVLNGNYESFSIEELED